MKETLDPKADVVIDSSVSDVFLAKSGLPIEEAVKGMKRQLRENGVFICFSMNNITIRRHVMDENYGFKHVYYTFIRLKLPGGTKKRKTTGTTSVPRADISLWVCSDSELQVEEVRNVEKVYFGTQWLHNPDTSEIRNMYAESTKFLISNQCSEV